MKKLALVAVVAAFGFASCKKDHTCSCSGTNVPSQWKSFDYGKTKKSDAQETCDAQETTLKNGGYSDASCELK